MKEKKKRRKKIEKISKKILQPLVFAENEVPRRLYVKNEYTVKDTGTTNKEHTEIINGYTTRDGQDQKEQKNSTALIIIIERIGQSRSFIHHRIDNLTILVVRLQILRSTVQV
ncbi:MAG: hypothetical protein ACI8RD_002614 [Bacillariaceae sp.]